MLSGGPRPPEAMTERIGAITASMTLASPKERGRVAIPACEGIGEPLFEHFHLVNVMPFQCPSDNDACTDSAMLSQEPALGV